MTPATWIIVRDVEDPEHGYRLQVLTQEMTEERRLGTAWTTPANIERFTPNVIPLRFTDPEACRTYLRTVPAGWWLGVAWAESGGRPRFLLDRTVGL